MADKARQSPYFLVNDLVPSKVYPTDGSASAIVSAVKEVAYLTCYLSP